jgi:phage-related protein
MARKLEVQIVGDASSLKRALGDAEGHTSKFGSALGGVAKAGVLAAGAAGIGGLFVTLKAGIDDYKESAKVGAQTTAVIKSTGGAARVTAKDVGDLATSVSNYSGVDDEAVQAGENMLLTFKNVRNEAGKGNDIFNQSTAILTDMSVAMGTDMSKQAIQLGKALNDPVKGISALSKVGVTFSDSQKSMIKSLVDTGDTAGAQKIILQELQSEFGGSAKAAGDTLPGQLSKLQNAFGNLSGELVGAAAPALTSFLGLVTDKGLPALGGLFDKIQKAAGPAIAVLSDAFAKAGPIVTQVLTGIGSALSTAWDAIQPLLGALGKVIRDDVIPIWEKLGQIAGDTIDSISKVLRDNEPQLRTIFENIGSVVKVLGGLLSDVATIAMPLIKFAFEVVLPTALKIAIPILEATTTAIKAIFDGIDWVAKNIGAPLEAVKEAFTAVKNWVSGRVSDIVGFFHDLPDKVRGAFVDAWEGIKGRITGAFDGIVTHVAGLPGRIATAFGGIPGAIAAELKGKADDLWGAVKHIFDKLPGFVKSALGIASPSKVFHGIGLAIMDGAIKGIKDKAGDLLDAAEGAFGKIGGAVKGGLNAVGGGGVTDPGLVDIGHQLQLGGFQVSENPYFGGVHPVHAPNSYHYKGRAIDVNWPGGGSVELGHLRQAYSWLSGVRHVELLLEDIGTGNQHLHFAMREGGVFTKPTTGMFSVAESGPEAFVPLDRYGGFNSPTPIVVNVAGSVISERDLAVAIRDQLERHGDRNSGIGWTRPGA